MILAVFNYNGFKATELLESIPEEFSFIAPTKPLKAYEINEGQIVQQVTPGRWVFRFLSKVKLDDGQIVAKYHFDRWE